MSNELENKQSLVELAQPINTGATSQDFPLDPLKLQSMMDYLHFKKSSERPSSGKYKDINQGLQTLDECGLVEGVMRSLDTDEQTGITGTSANIKQRIDKYGSNAPAPIIIDTVWKIVYDNLADTFVMILIGAAVVSLFIGIYNEGFKYGWIDGVSISVAIVIITTVNTANEYSKQLAFRKLMENAEISESSVIRDGKTEEIDSYQLVVGDIVKVENGKKIPADMVLIQSERLQLNEADMTGESEVVDKNLAAKYDMLKNDPNPFLLQGTHVENGSGLAVVVAVGQLTQANKADHEMDFEKDPTPLQQKLDTLVEQIGIVGCIAAAMTFAAMFIRLLLSIFLYKSRSLTDEANISEILNAFIVAITIIVMAIPEGLPLAVAICLAFSVGKLQIEEQVQVKRIEATEIMGGAEEICTDKTGTLTTGKMVVVKCWINNEIVNVAEVTSKLNNLQLEELLHAVMYNTDSTYVKTANGVEIRGNNTDNAILRALKDDWKLNAEGEQETFKTMKADKKTIFITPFNSTRKRMTTAVKLPSGVVRLFVKGSAGVVLPKCKQFYDNQGKLVELDDVKKASVLSKEGVVGKLAGQSLRCLCIGYVDYKEAEWNMRMKGIDTEEGKDDLEQNLKMLMMVAIKDPLKEGVPEAVADLKNAGVRTRMVTGDIKLTAIAIAIEAGILDKDWEKQTGSGADLENPTAYEERLKYTCMEGDHFKKFVGIKDEEILPEDADYREPKEGEKAKRQTRKAIGNLQNFKIVSTYLSVLANSSNEHKYCLVSGLRGKSIYADDAKVVAVTGDGTNDALALRKADVGFAMANGSEAAKKAGSVVLLTNDFSKTLACVKYGRNIFDCVKKFLMFQMTVNVVAMTVVFLGAAVFGESVMTSVQILWVNLIMDTFAALALATEAPTNELLKRKPHKRNAKIIDSVMWRNVFGQTLFQVIAILVTLVWGREILGYEYPNSMGMYMTDKWLALNPDWAGVIEVGAATPKLHVYTVAFQLFVFMQLFNQINARKLGDKEYNVFAGIFQNNWFLGISAITFVMQIAIVYIGGRPLRTVPLTTNENVYAIGLAAMVIPWAVFCKMFIPAAWFEQVAIAETPMTPAQRHKSTFASTSRASYNDTSRDHSGDKVQMKQQKK